MFDAEKVGAFISKVVSATEIKSVKWWSNGPQVQLEAKLVVAGEKINIHITAQPSVLRVSMNGFDIISGEVKDAIRHYVQDEGSNAKKPNHSTLKSKGKPYTWDDTSLLVSRETIRFIKDLDIEEEVIATILDKHPEYAADAEDAYEKEGE